jgi:hypothetical protein
MQHREYRRTLERWLRAGAPDTTALELESAWRELLAELPDEAPSAAFTSRVMLRVAEVRDAARALAPRVRAARDLSPRLRLVLAACLGLVGVSVLALPVVLVALPLPVGGLIAALASAVKAGAVWAAQGFSVWEFLADLGQTIAVVLATPEATAFLVSFALLSAAAFRWLFELTRTDRRSADATSG